MEEREWKGDGRERKERRWSAKGERRKGRGRGGEMMEGKGEKGVKGKEGVKMEGKKRERR